MSFIALAMVLMAQEKALYPSSVVGTDFDFITEADPSAFERLEYEGEALSEMPNKTSSAPLRQQAFVFVATPSTSATGRRSCGSGVPIQTSLGMSELQGRADGVLRSAALRAGDGRGSRTRSELFLEGAARLDHGALRRLVGA